LSARPVPAGHEILKTAIPALSKFSSLIPRLAFAALAFSAACAVRPPVLAPVPERVNTLDGYGSLSIRSSGSSMKSRFAFFFRPPGDGRVEALDVFGRTVSVLLFREGRAYMILPAKRVYWEGREEEILGKFLGFGLRSAELSAILCGRWADLGPGSDWRIERDAGGRVLRGDRGGFRFEVVEFHRGAPVPRAVEFAGPESSGRLRILKIHFNSPPRGDPFNLSVLKDLNPKTWPEIEALLRDEN
jgi:hypothetical protein